MDASGFLAQTAQEIGELKTEAFSEKMATDFKERGIESPIEQILYVAICGIKDLKEIPDADPVTIRGKHYLAGLYIEPQCKIGRYRVDFSISFGRLKHLGPGKRRFEERALVVECDSQQWHERTPEERAAEKERERFLVKQGHKILRYTGREIHRRPFEVAEEILTELKAL